MALKGWLDAGKCLIGIHQGEWAREAATSCVWLQTCERCGVANRRVEHSWSQWAYTTEEHCALTRACDRCRESEERTEHHWGEWQYREVRSCEQGIVCQRCHAVSEERRTQHHWGHWQYSERHRAPLHGCERCALQASYFTDQVVEQQQLAATESVNSVLSDDQAIADLVQQSEHAEANSAQAAAIVDDNNWERETFTMIQRLYNEEIAAGRITAERQTLLTSIVNELGNAVENPATSLADKQIKARLNQDLLLRLREALLDPSRTLPVEKPVPGSPLATILELHNDLHRYVITETAGAMLTGEEGKAIAALMGRFVTTREALAALPPDADTVKIEREALRQLAVDVRNFSLRHHLTVANPVWPSAAVAGNANAVFYSGGQQIGALLTQVSRSRGLQLLMPQAHREPASLRWDQLRQAAVAVFDFTGYTRAADLQEASGPAAVAYELGIALTLGRAVVIVSTENQDLPFDLDIEPIRLQPNEADPAALRSALDHALYSLQRNPAGSSVPRTVRYLHSRFGDHADFHVRLSLDSIDAEAAQDAIKARLLMASTFSFLGPEAPQMITPVWPGDYPDAANKRCFHVSAFGPAWADRTMEIVKAVCAPNIEYIRGDKVLEPDILRSIWDEICRATHLVVDLTGLNANVSLELGIAHALGRNVLLISQDQQPERYFRAIAKHRICPYALGNDSAVELLKSTLVRFLQ